VAWSASNINFIDSDTVAQDKASVEYTVTCAGGAYGPLSNSVTVASTCIEMGCQVDDTCDLSGIHQVTSGDDPRCTDSCSADADCVGSGPGPGSGNAPGGYKEVTP
jgi:hypothetical protein